MKTAKNVHFDSQLVKEFLLSPRVNDTCPCCGMKLMNDSYYKRWLIGEQIQFLFMCNVDHIISRYSGGLDTIDNLQLIHRFCNGLYGPSFGFLKDMIGEFTKKFVKFLDESHRNVLDMNYFDILILFEKSLSKSDFSRYQKSKMKSSTFYAMVEEKWEWLVKYKRQIP